MAVALNGHVSSHDGQQGSLANAHSCHRLFEDVAHTTRGARQQVFVLEFPFESLGPNPACGSMHCEKRNGTTGGAMQPGRAVNDVQPCVARQPFDIDFCEVDRRNEQGVGQEVVEPSTRSANDDDPINSHPDRGAKREFEISVVLVGWVQFQWCVAIGGKRLCRNRVHVADDQIDFQSQCKSLIESGVRGHVESVVGQVFDDIWINDVATGQNYCCCGVIHRPLSLRPIEALWVAPVGVLNVGK